MTRCCAVLATAVLMMSGCFETMSPPPGTVGAVQPAVGGDGGLAMVDTISYRDNLALHAGCSTAGLTYVPAVIPGYQCAAKAYPLAGVAEDTERPIVLLVHGNSDTPDSWERFPAESGAPMIAEQLTAAGMRTYAIDLRIDLNDDPQGNNDTENAARNIDHGWAVPLVEHFVEATLAAWPDRRISLVGFSLGSTVIRDALRRIHGRGEVAVFERVEDVVLLAGAHHGVSTYARLCGRNPTMRGQIACELGSRDSYAPTDFLIPLNGVGGADETPCFDGGTVYGAVDACAGNVVTYTTVVMSDIADGSYQDEFVSEASSRLDNADNHLIALSDVDESGYFFNGLLKNHYGAARSAAAVSIVVTALTGQ